MWSTDVFCWWKASVTSAKAPRVPVIDLTSMPVKWCSCIGRPAASTAASPAPMRSTFVPRRHCPDASSNQADRFIGSKSVGETSAICQPVRAPASGPGARSARSGRPHAGPGTLLGGVRRAKPSRRREACPRGSAKPTLGVRKLRRPAVQPAFSFRSLRCLVAQARLRAASRPSASSPPARVPQGEASRWPRAR